MQYLLPVLTVRPAVVLPGWKETGCPCSVDILGWITTLYVELPLKRVQKLNLYKMLWLVYSLGMDI